MRLTAVSLGPVHNPPNDVFDSFDQEQEQILLGSLSLEADDEPIRRGASRANSVRFDISANQGPNWGHASRNSGDFGPARPGSGYGSHAMTERSSSHKSDGRHSSAGHSVHSMHSASGRTSSLGLDTNFMIGGQADDSPLDVPEPPPGLFVLGSVPSIIRCWLNQDFSHISLLYAVVCTGSQKSLLDYNLVKDLRLVDQLRKNNSGNYMIRLPVYLPEAIITQPSSRSNSPAPHLPTLTATFEVIGVGQRTNPERRKSLRVFIGSDTLRAHSADLLFSQNIMTLYGDDRNKLSVPFVRPEDDNMFKNLCTTNLVPDRNELKATAPAFTPLEQKTKHVATENGELQSASADTSSTSLSQALSSTVATPAQPASDELHASTAVDAGHPQTAQRQGDDQYVVTSTEGRAEHAEGQDASKSRYHHMDSVQHDQHSGSDTGGPADGARKDATIWSSWRRDSIPSNVIDNARDLSAGSNPPRPLRGGRNMKVLKASKPSSAASNRSASSAAHTGSAYEPALSRPSGESRRKSQGGPSDGMGALRWESKRSAVEETKTPKELRTISNVARSSNPIGGASAFAWMNPERSITTHTTAD